MVRGKDFEVTKEVFERAKAQYKGDKPGYSYYMTDDDKNDLFNACLLYGYGVYNCKVHEENGKYICTWCRGATCD